MLRLSRFTTRKIKRKERTVGSFLCCVEVTRLHLFTLFFRHSPLIEEGRRKLAEKAGFSEASSSRDKRDIPERPWYDIVTEMFQRFDEYGMMWNGWNQVRVDTCSTYKMQETQKINYATRLHFRFRDYETQYLWNPLYLTSYFIHLTARGNKSDSKSS